MSNNNNWRGGGRGGRGRGRGGGNRNYNNNDSYNNDDYNNGHSHDNVPITARLGPNGGNSGNISSRLGPTNGPSNNFNDNRNQPFQNNHQNNNNNHHSNNYNNNNQRGRGFHNNRGRGRGGQGGGNRFTRGFADEDISMQTDAPNGITVKVTGFPKGSEEKVVGFLTRKSKTVWEPLHIEYGHNFMNITVADDSAADALCRMNNFNFGNAQLQLTRAGEGSGNYSQTNRPGNRDASRSSDTLREFIKERFEPHTGQLVMDEVPTSSHNLSLVFSKLLEVAFDQVGQSVVALSFARNKLRNVSPLVAVMDYFPNIVSLSLQDNEITEFRNFDRLANKLPALQKIELAGNPIISQTDPETLRSELMKRFPSLQYIDVLSDGGNELPVPIRKVFFDTENSAMACQDLLVKFFPLFDTNRPSLLALYDAQSVFSCVFSNNGNFQQQNIWGSPQVPVSQRLVIGNENIVKRLVGLPPTQHDISNGDNFATDAWQTPGNQTYSAYLHLVVHGEFLDASTGTPLSFDRTFIVAPSVLGTSAHSAGWSYVILSDSLIVRNFSCKPGSLVTAS